MALSRPAHPRVTLPVGRSFYKKEYNIMKPESVFRITFWVM
jgi:hypothetical protein